MKVLILTCSPTVLLYTDGLVERHYDVALVIVWQHPQDRRAGPAGRRPVAALLWRA